MSLILWLDILRTNVVIQSRDEISRVPAYKPAFKSITKIQKNFLQPIIFVLYFFQGTFIKDVIYAPFHMMEPIKPGEL